MLLKIAIYCTAITIAITSAQSAIHKYASHSRSGVTITATCPNEDDLWEHVERCTIDVQPNR